MARTQDVQDFRLSFARELSPWLRQSRWKRRLHYGELGQVDEITDERSVPKGRLLLKISMDRSGVSIRGEAAPKHIHVPFPGHPSPVVRRVLRLLLDDLKKEVGESLTTPSLEDRSWLILRLLRDIDAQPEAWSKQDAAGVASLDPGADGHGVVRVIMTDGTAAGVSLLAQFLGSDDQQRWYPLTLCDLDEIALTAIRARATYKGEEPRFWPGPWWSGLGTASSRALGTKHPESEMKTEDAHISKDIPKDAAGFLARFERELDVWLLATRWKRRRNVDGELIDSPVAEIIDTRSVPWGRLLLKVSVEPSGVWIGGTARKHFTFPMAPTSVVRQVLRLLLDELKKEVGEVLSTGPRPEDWNWRLLRLLRAIDQDFSAWGNQVGIRQSAVAPILDAGGAGEIRATMQHGADGVSLCATFPGCDHSRWYPLTEVELDEIALTAVRARGIGTGDKHHQRFWPGPWWSHLRPRFALPPAEGQRAEMKTEDPRISKAHEVLSEAFVPRVLEGIDGSVELELHDRIRMLAKEVEELRAIIHDRDNRQPREPDVRNAIAALCFDQQDPERWRSVEHDGPTLDDRHGLLELADAVLAEVERHAQSPEDVALQRRLAKIDDKHGPLYNSAHEALGVLLEEVHEFQDEIFLKEKKRSLEQIHYEAIDVACSAMRSARWARCKLEEKREAATEEEPPSDLLRGYHWICHQCLWQFAVLEVRGAGRWGSYACEACGEVKNHEYLMHVLGKNLPEVLQARIRGVTT